MVVGRKARRQRTDSVRKALPPRGRRAPPAAARRRPGPLRLLALACGLWQALSAQAIVIQVNALDSNGFVIRREISEDWRREFYGSTSQFYYRYKDSNSMLVPGRDAFMVLSEQQPWTLSGTLQVDHTTLGALTLRGGQLASTGSVLGRLTLQGGALTGAVLAVSGATQVQGAGAIELSGWSSFDSLSLGGGSRFSAGSGSATRLSLDDATFWAGRFTAGSADITASTLRPATELMVSGRLSLSRSVVGEAGRREGQLQADALVLNDSAIVTGRLAVGQSLQIRNSQVLLANLELGQVSELVLQASGLQAEGYVDHAMPLRLDLQGSSLLLASGHLRLWAGPGGTDALGLDAGSTLVTASTRLWADAARPDQTTTFTQTGGLHRTGWLDVPEHTVYRMAVPTGGAAAPTLSADTLAVNGLLRMHGGSLSGTLGVGTGGSFEQLAGQALLVGLSVSGTARLSGTAQMDSGNTTVSGRALEVLQSARLSTGRLEAFSGNVLLNRPGDTRDAPALRSSLVAIHSGFQHTQGHHEAVKVDLRAGINDTESGWYWLDGGVLTAESLWTGGHFVQRGGEARITSVSVNAVHQPADANLLLAGGRFDTDHLSAWVGGGSAAPLIRQTGGTARMQQLSLFGARYELAIDQPDAGTDDLTLTTNLWISGTAEQPGSFAHSAGRVFSLGQQAVDAYGEYRLTGSGVFDGRQSDEPFEVLSGARFTQDGVNTLLQARGLSVDAEAQGLMRDGQTALREWLAVSGALRIDGQARVTVGGSEFGLQVGLPFLPDDHEDLTPGQGPGWLTLALAGNGLLHTSQAGVGTFESGVLQHDSGRHQVDSTLTLGSSRVLSDAVLLLGSTLADLTGAHAALDAQEIVLVNDMARTDAERKRVRLEQVLGRSSLAFQNFSNRQGLHYIHAVPAGDAPQDGAGTWRLGDTLAPDGSRLYASYASEGGALFVQGGLHLADNSRMTIAPSLHLRGWAEVQGALQIGGRATLALADQALLRDGEGRPTLRVRGGLALDSQPGDPQAWAMAVRSATVQVLGGQVAADTATVHIGPSRSTQSLLLDGAGTLMQISGAQRTQLHIGTQGAGSVSVSHQAALELRAAPPGTVRPAISGTWQPLVIGRADMPGQPELTVDSSSRLLVEGLGHQITVASGTASLAGTFQAVVLGKPGSPAVVGRPASANGLLKLADSSRIEVSFDGYVPQAGDYLPLASAHSILWGSNAGSLGLTPYQAVTVAGVSGYEFSLGAGNAVFRVAAPTAGLYPALERMHLNGTEVLGIRFVDQAVVLNFVDRIGGRYAASGTGWTYQPSDRVAMAGTSLNQAALVQAFGSALWGTAPEQWLGTGSLGTQLLLPYFVADDAVDASRRLANAVEVRFSDTRVGSLEGHAPAQSNSSGWFPIDLGNARKDGLVHVLDAAAAQASDPAGLTSTVLHEVGHALGLLHSYQAGTANRMDDVDTTGERFSNQPLAWTEAPTAQGWNLLLSQNAQLHLLKYSFGWSDAELAAFGAQYGTLDGGFGAALNSLLLSVKASLSGLGEALSFAQLTVQTPSLTADGATLWEPLLTLDAAALADLQNLQFSGIRGLDFRLVGTLAGQPDAELHFVGEGQGSTGRFGEGQLAGRLVQLNLATGEQLDLGSYTLTQTAAVPEPAAPALLGAGGLLLWALRRRARAGAAGAQ